jgi:hypothetical protein
MDKINNLRDHGNQDADLDNLRYLLANTFSYHVYIGESHTTQVTAAASCPYIAPHATHLVTPPDAIVRSVAAQIKLGSSPLGTFASINTPPLDLNPFSLAPNGDSPPLAAATAHDTTPNKSKSTSTLLGIVPTIPHQRSEHLSRGFSVARSKVPRTRKSVNQKKSRQSNCAYVNVMKRNAP